MQWFRFYSEFRSDPKMRRMPIAHRYAFVVLLCLANESSTRGKITGLDDDDIAYELEMSTEDWLTLKAKFKAKGLITWEGDEITIVNWDKRQYDKPSDRASSTRERKRRQRAKQKQSEPVQNEQMSRDVTPSHADVTPSHALYTDTDTDPDPDPESDPEKITTQSEGSIVSHAVACNSRTHTTRVEILDPEVPDPEVGGILAVQSSPVKNSPASQQTTKGTNSPAKSRRKKNEDYSDDFEDWWAGYYSFCLDVGASAGSKLEAWGVFQAEQLPSPDFLEGDEYYRASKQRQFLDRGEAIGVPHGVRYIRNRRWQEALDHKRRTGINPAINKANLKAAEIYANAARAIAHL